MAGTFMKRPGTDDAALVHTTAEAMDHMRRGYVVCTWDDWYSARLARETQQTQRVRALEGGKG